MLDDQQLLRRYTADGSEAAFGELVARYANLVYSAALRRTGGDPDLAQDVAQLVFTDVDTNAPPMSAESRTKLLDDLARSMEGVHDVTLKSWLPDPDRDDSRLVFFGAAWPDDSRALDKPAGGTLVFRRVGNGWYLDAFVGQGHPRL